jgi:hypothetical protein
MLILNFTYPLRCLRVPLGVRVPPVEYHWSRLRARLVSDSPVGAGIFSLHHRIQTWCLPSLLFNGRRSPFAGNKAAAA